MTNSKGIGQLRSAASGAHAPRNTPEAVRAIPEFAHLRADELAAVSRIMHTRHLARHELLYLEGESGQALYYLHSGLIKLFKTAADGKEQTLQLLHAGASFNHVSVLDGGPNLVSALALEPSDLYLCYRRDLLPLLTAYPNIALGLIQVLAARLRYAVDLVEDLSFRHITARVAKLLLTYNCGLKSHGLHRLTQTELADLAGTRRELVSRALKTLAQEGAIAVNRGHITILDRSKLVALC
jgi:CRP-like cAMP-binding protein